MTDHKPRVSIGMPVRNGQKYIREAIESILAQTFTDWELIVCDNASTDSTEQIVREYAARDPRVRYHRNPLTSARRTITMSDLNCRVASISAGTRTTT